MNSSRSGPDLLPIAMGGQQVHGCIVGCDYCCSTQHALIAPGFAKPLVVGTAWDALQLGEKPAAVPGELETFDQMLKLPVFNGIWAWTVRTDGLLPLLEPYFNQFLQTINGQSLAVLISKIPISKERLKRLWNDHPNLAFLPGITGMGEPFEGVTVAQHLRTIENCTKIGVRAAANISPAIAELSDLRQLGRQLVAAGCTQAVLRGFAIDRHPARMTKIKAALSDPVREMYMNTPPDEAVLWPGAHAELEEAGIEVVTQEQWLLEQWHAYRRAAGIQPLLREDAEAQVELLLPHAFEYGAGAIEAAIQRRCT